MSETDIIHQNVFPTVNTFTVDIALFQGQQGIIIQKILV